jgi:aminomethyltransferase
MRSGIAARLASRSWRSYITVPADILFSTPLSAAHRSRGARMTPFAGYDMPVSYPAGVLKEHLWTRAHAGLFDVSHMGPAFLTLNARSGDPAVDHAAVSALIEPLICGDIAGLAPGRLRYTLLLNAEGGIIDDLMVGRPTAPDRQGELYLVVNAATKPEDFALITEAAGPNGRLTRADDGALIAVQGPEATAVLEALIPGVGALGFMSFAPFGFEGESVRVSRSGYTGEDGFEILCPASLAEGLWERLLADERAWPIGLGARDSLRLEAGLPLYGHDIDATTSPLEAGLAFAVSKRRLKAGTLRGAARLAKEAAEGTNRLRIGLTVDGAPAREGAEIVGLDGAPIGIVTSGGFSPSLGAPIAMGYAPPALATPGADLRVTVRGRAQNARVTAMPFVPHRYHRPATKPET